MLELALSPSLENHRIYDLVVQIDYGVCSSMRL